MDRTRAVLKYWRNSLADVELRSPFNDKDRDDVRPITAEEIEAASLSQETTSEFFLRAERERAGRRQKRRKEDEKEDPPLQSVTILIAPFSVGHDYQHGKVKRGKREWFHPLWIPALLKRDGTLLPLPQSPPWMSRECLEPGAGDAPVVGTLDDFDRFLATRLPPRDGDWEDMLRYRDEMLKAVLHFEVSDLRIEGFQVNEAGICLLQKEDKGAAKGLLDLYDELLGKKEEEAPPRPALLEKLITGVKPTTAPPSHGLETDSQVSTAARHCGQMGDRFPLSPSQRQVIYSLLELADGEILTVNGPPGTGKTTLLQSVIASLWVEAALAEVEPPVILACSTNNQAVTNILDSFVGVGSRENPLSERWLPDLGSYGLYLPSQDKYKDSPYQKAFSGRSWQGLPEIMENSGYLEHAEAYFTLKAQAAVPQGRTTSVQDIVRSLHEQMKAARAELAETLKEAQKVAEWRRYSCEEGSNPFEQIRQARDTLESRIAEEESLYQEVLAAESASPLWEVLLSFFPPVRRHRERRLSMPFLRRHREAPKAGGRDFPQAVQEYLRGSVAALKSQAEGLKDWEKAEARFASRVQKAVGRRSDLEPFAQQALSHPEKVVDPLDCGLRHHLFLLAGRYWEGRWLLEMKNLVKEGKRFDRQTRAACEERFRRFAKLTPCLVSTLYRAPRFLDFFDPSRDKGVPLLQFLDLLIIDEAGQVTPEVGAAVFALARRALVVGDIHQIEPVWGVPPSIDMANLRKAGLQPAAENREDAATYQASRGSLMLLARKATAVTCDTDEGLFLSEHRRCVPEIVRYCNDLVYRGRLEPLRPEKRERILPAMGWAHITSPEKTVSGSRFNPGEAQAIAEWLARHQGELEKHYKTSLENIVAVITPFAAQKRALSLACEQHGLPEIKSGTVHTFQGAESPIVLFSSVYSLSSQTPPPARLFFDVSSNLLNVAASRAKDSFQVFGDIRLFDKTKVDLPSGKLARLLFESPYNEITDVESAQHLVSVEGTTRITTLEGHREILRKALTESTGRVLIVSPYMTSNAVEADEVPAAVRSARQRKVQVSIIYSVDLNRRWRDSTERAATALREAGAEVVASNRVHSKTLAVDHRWIVEGSFNWLSAVRKQGDRYSRQEASLCCRGSEAKRFIEDAWREVLGAGPS